MKERSPNIVVIDYESGNLRSVAKALESLGVTPLVTGDPDLLATADGAILPGVGSAPQAMSALESRELVEPIKAFLATGGHSWGSAWGSSCCSTAPRRATPHAWASSPEP